MPPSSMIEGVLRRVTARGRSLIGQSRRDVDLIAECKTIVSTAGQASGLARARDVLDRYAAANDDRKLAFLSGLATEFGPDAETLNSCIDRYLAADTPSGMRDLHQVSEPGGVEVIRRLNRAPGATADLLSMRTDILRLKRGNAELEALDRDFRHLFGSWFNLGFLELRRIDWSVPAAILEKIITYEAVHEFQGWEDLRRRVAAPDRRLYAFFHPAMEGEPLIFVQVALTKEIPRAIAPILAEDRDPLPPQEANTAVFYSITNCQEGLRGIAFGSFLIKQVVEQLRFELEGLERFVTLSPMPGLRAWAVDAASRGDDLLAPRHRATIESLETDQPGDGAAPEAQPSTLAEIAAIYLTRATRPEGGARDPVAHFHLGNGARLEAINPGADTGRRGWARSWGVMVNYLYDFASIERNHEAYANEGTMTCSSAIRRLARTRKDRN